MSDRASDERDTVVSSSDSRSSSGSTAGRLDDDPGLENARVIETIAVPFIQFEIRSGGVLGGLNVSVGSNGQEDFFDSYVTLGFPDESHPRVKGTNNEFGLVFHSDSSILRGMRAETSESVRAKIDGISIPHVVTTAYSHNNRWNVTPWIAKVIGSSSRAEILHSRPSNFPEEAIGGSLPAGNSDLSGQRVVHTDDVRELLAEGESFDRIDALSDPLLRDRLGSEPTPRDVEMLQVIKAVVEGYVSAGSAYWSASLAFVSSSAQTIDERSFKVGQIIGVALDYAAAKGKPLAILVTGDGSHRFTAFGDATCDSQMVEGALRCSSDGSTPGWTTLNRSLAFMLVYNPSARPSLTSEERQIGRFVQYDNRANETNQPALYYVTDTSSGFSSPEGMAYTAALNYLALAGKLEEADIRLGPKPFDEPVDSVVRFTPLCEPDCDP